MTSQVRVRAAFGRASAIAALCLLAFSAPASTESVQFDDTVEVPEETAFLWHVGQNRDLEADKEWFFADFTKKNPNFRTAWRRQAARIIDDALVLPLRPSQGEEDKDFIGAEIQRRDATHYGRYEVVMTPAVGEGVVSSFFTYTGPWFGNPHDEIDIEFLGRDTTKVWLNRFAEGDNLPGRWVELGFDAADGPRLYAFEWTPERITWYAGTTILLSIKASEFPIPTTPKKVYLNIWGGNERQAKWSGTAPDDTRAQAKYYCMSYQPAGADTPQCSDRPLP